MRRSEIPVGQAFLEDAPGDFAVQIQPLGLFVLFVPAEIQPFQALKNRIHRRLGIPPHIGVVQAQNHRPAMMAGIEPVKNKSAGAAHVQKACGRRSKPDARL